MIYRKLLLFFTFLFILGKISLFSQTPAVEIESLLGAPVITYAQAARFVLDASDVLNTQDNNQAFAFALQANWLKNVQANDAASLDKIALLLMKSFDVNGGIFYKLTSNSIYAYRELSYKEVIIGKQDPAMPVSGERLLFMVSRLFALREREAAIAASKPQKLSQLEKEAEKRREDLAAEITSFIEEYKIADTTVEATQQGVTITLSNIQFYADSARLAAQEQAKLREVANILKNIPNIKLLVAGHTALAGVEAGRTALSLARAQTVADYLVSLGACAKENITAVGFGADRPIADNSTEEGMAANRRVEITILDQGSESRE